MIKLSRSFLILGVAFAALFGTPLLNAQTLASMSGTDIYNGLRGQNFNEGWKFNKGDVSGGQNTGYNDSSWSNVTLPHDWSIFNSFNQASAAGSGGGYLDGGIGWYRKTFTVPADNNGKRVFIEFDGAYMNSQVWINGTSLGTRPYGYISFEYEVTPYLVYDGSNVIAVRINNNVPTSRWYSGSGIYRNVWLTVLDPVHVGYCGMFVTTPSVSSSSATVSIGTRVVNQGSVSRSVTLTATMYDGNGNPVASNTSSAANIGAGGNNTFSQNLAVSNPQLWSPGSPNLYTAQIQVIAGGSVVDTFRSTTGIRYFNFDANNGFSLNGTGMKLKGVCNHHDLGSLGSAVNYRAIERQLQILKAMGCNALRTAHNPPDPQVLDVCDRLGIMVMDEVFDCWETGKATNDYHLSFGNWAKTDIQALVARDRNHPSVIIWSMGNEIFNATLATATNLKNWIKEIDSSRPVTCGSNDTYNGLTTDILNILDLVGYNYNPGLYDARHSSYPNWKIIGSETSSAVRSRGIYKTPTNQNILTGSDNQCSSYDNSVASWGNSAESSYTAINSRKYMAGEFIWTGFDYIGEPVPYGWPAKSSYFGIIDTCGFPKDIYYFYQSKWSVTPMVHVLPHWNWSSGTTVEVWAYSNCDTVELFLNGVSQGSKSVGSSLRLVWNVSWISGTLQAKGTKGGTVVYDQVSTAGSAAKVVLKPDRTGIIADGKDLVFVEADITDSNNNLCPNATNTVNFSVSGPGTIVGVDNGNAAGTESYKGNSRMAFSGKCLVIVQTTKISGSITITGSSSGLSSGSVTVISAGEGTPAPTAEPTTVPTIGPTPVPGSISIACGSSEAVGDFQPDQYYSGGSTFNNTNTVDVSLITDNPPPAVLFNNERYGAMSYTIPGFNAGGSYSVMLYFAETYLTSSGSRLFDVSVNGAAVLSDFDIYASAGGQNKAIAKSFTTTADGSGQITIQFTAGTENPMLNGIDIIPVTNGGLLGDVNGDGSVTIVDALLIAQYYVGSIPAVFIGANADVNCSGTIDIVDALRVAQYYVGLITSFSC